MAKDELKRAIFISQLHCPISGHCDKKSVRSEKLQSESFPNFSIFRPGFCPEFCSEFSPNFSRIFRASLHGKRRPEKIHQKSPPFFNAKFPGKFEEKNLQKCFWRAVKVKKRRILSRLWPSWFFSAPSKEQHVVQSQP